MPRTIAAMKSRFLRGVKGDTNTQRFVDPGGNLTPRRQERRPGHIDRISRGNGKFYLVLSEQSKEIFIITDVFQSVLEGFLEAKQANTLETFAETFATSHCGFTQKDLNHIVNYLAHCKMDYLEKASIRSMVSKTVRRLPDAVDIAPDERTLGELHVSAREEDGALIVFHASHNEVLVEKIVSKFKELFPGVSLDLRILTPGAIMDSFDSESETVADFVLIPHHTSFAQWKNERKLLQYKPREYSHVYDEFKDMIGSAMIRKL